jgi:hypothetical protein
MVCSGTWGPISLGAIHVHGQRSPFAALARWLCSKNDLDVQRIEQAHPPMSQEF